jgi:hypothetical protein
MGDMADMAMENEWLHGHPADRGWGSDDFDYAQGRTFHPDPWGGGLKPTTKRKEPAMKGKGNLEKELAQIEVLLPTLVERRDEIKRMLANAFPSPTNDRISVRVRFGGSTIYEYLMLRTPGGKWYTTGTTADTKVFGGWQQVQRWLADKRVTFVEITELTAEGDR